MDIEANKEYYRNLPKKRASAAAIFLNGRGEMLILKPNYKEGWLLPGGTIETDESPFEAACRETREELGLETPIGRLLCVDYVAAENIVTERFTFVFYGGILGDDQIGKIKLQEEELGDYRFVDLERALELVTKPMRNRLPHCLDAVRDGGMVYLENGQPIKC